MRATLLCFFLFAGRAVGGEPFPPLSLTSDTAQYCRELADRVHSCGSRRQEIMELELQGRAMCRTGLVHGGIVRLRKAASMLLLAAPGRLSGCLTISR